jgi:hypothetical protein
VLEDFGRFWEAEADPVKRRELVGQLFERVWIDDSRIVAVRPTRAFAPFFERRPGGRGHRPTNDNAALIGTARLKVRERRDSNPRPPA